MYSFPFLLLLYHRVYPDLTNSSEDRLVIATCCSFVSFSLPLSLPLSQSLPSSSISPSSASSPVFCFLAMCEVGLTTAEVERALTSIDERDVPRLRFLSLEDRWTAVDEEATTSTGTELSASSPATGSLSSSSLSFSSTSPSSSPPPPPSTSPSP
ncbi:hypothetical protein K505DRAFT_133371, partial [Melanomma pulvis-pyrius CBS 109.77]